MMQRMPVRGEYSMVSQLGRPTGLLAIVLLLLNVACAKSVETCFDETVTAQDYQCALKYDGLRRTFRAHLPSGYDPSRPAPLVFAFHGGIGTGKFMERHTGLNAVANENYFVAVYPDGYHRTWNAGACCEDAMRKNVDDVGFVRAMITELSKKLSINHQRIYATGFSNGSMLSHRLACDLSDRIAAIATVSGVIMMPPCAPADEMSVLVIHGTEDPRSLWAGGLGAKDPDKGVRDSIPVTMDRLYDRYHCAAGDTVFLQQNAVTCTRRDCSNGAEVGLCRVEGGGHQWPGAEAIWPDKLGPVNQDISASRVIWDFFAAHSQRARTESASLQ